MGVGVVIAKMTESSGSGMFALKSAAIRTMRAVAV